MRQVVTESVHVDKLRSSNVFSTSIHTNTWPASEAKLASGPYQQTTLDWTSWNIYRLFRVKYTLNIKLVFFEI